MSKRKWIGLGLVVVAALATVLLILPWFADDDRAASSAPEFSAVAVIDDARLVLPPVAGGAAAIYFTIANRGLDTLFMTEVSLAEGRGTEFVYTTGATATPLVNVAIHPGETVRLGPGSGHIVLTGYNSNVVPGAAIDMTLTFQNGQTATVPARVQASPS
jgi:periplasmic copper chaperone A